MHIQQMVDQLAAAVRERFPKGYTPAQRILAMIAQLGEVADLELIREGAKEDFKQQHNKLEAAAFNLIIDWAVLMQQLNVDVDAEFNRAVAWFKNSKPS